ncbi:signal peptidase I [Deinococcus cavernae]|uniref:Signal peptidase I n=1 Tax=Deinococcus cavernae TaxID=2320857 RepID=A0A418V5A6_9DEIO|nr:signal peptidase I [Deinococcus cavernae]RJF71292.1 signal peptidase I [Deinococcus cavernae]
MKRGQLTANLREWTSTLLFALGFTQFAASAVQVDGTSMLPTLRHGEVLLLPKLEGWAHRAGWGQYQRGDIVVFKPPRDMEAEWTNQYRGLPLPWKYRPYLVKRVVGMPGDTVQIRAGVLYVNGRRVDEPGVLNYWQSFCHDVASDLANTSPVRIPARQYFVMGDNRSPGGSLDSRVFGPVSVHDIAARAPLSVLPLLRQGQVTPPCDTQPHPEQRTQPGGALEWSPRLLPPVGR